MSDKKISIVTKWWIKSGDEDAAVAALETLAAEVRDKEPFTSMYLIHTSIQEGSLPTPPANEVIFVGTWDNRAAFEKHLAGPVFSSWLAQHIDLFVTGDGGALYVSAEFIDRRTGFIRQSEVTETQSVASPDHKGAA